MSLWKLLGFTEREEAGGAETETVRKITQALDSMDPEKARFIAAFAYILGRAAHADEAISQEEVRAMERIVMEIGGLPEEQAIVVVQIAKTRNLLFGATENFLVTREFGRISLREERLRLLECLFAVSASEKGISVKEENEIRQIAKELLLEHRDYIAVRYKFREKLDVLRKPEPEDAA